MTLGNVWSFPSLPYDVTLEAMKALAGRIRKITADYKEPGHPIDIHTALEPAYLAAAAEVSRELRLAQPIPKLCTLVTASPFDLALHDAFGKAHGLNCYHTYGRDFMARDLASYLGPDFRGEYLDRYVLKEPKPRLAVYHSIGASDPIVESDVAQRVSDGLPETLPQWIFASEVSLLEQLADEDDFRIFAHFRLGEAAAFQQRDVHGTKIVVIGVANVRVRALPGLRSPASLDHEGKVRGLPG